VLAVTSSLLDIAVGAAVTVGVGWERCLLFDPDGGQRLPLDA
jgi:hypothetical protein